MTQFTFRNRTAGADAIRRLAYRCNKKKLEQVDLTMPKAPSRTSRPSLFRIAALVLILGIVPVDAVLAQAWEIRPSLRFGGEFDDNATLDIRTDEEVELQGYLVDIAADLVFDSPTTRFNIEPRFLLRRYDDEPDFDSDDIFVKSRYNFQGTSNTLGFRLNYDRQSVRTAERLDSDLDIEDPDEIPDNESGRTFRTGEREAVWFSPYWRYQITDTSSIGLDASYVDASYDDEISELLDDYTDLRLNLVYRRALSGATIGVVTATTRSYEAAESESEIDGFGVLAGVEHQLNQTMRLTVMAGVEDTDTIQVESDPEFVGNVTLARNMKTINMFVQYRRAVVASGISSLSLRDSISLNFRRSLTETIRAGLGARAYKSRGLVGTTVDDRNYVQFHAAFSWLLSRTWSFEAEYRYTILDRQDVFSESSNSNRVNLWFTWQPNSIPAF